MSWICRLWESIRKIFWKIISFFQEEPEVKPIISKIDRLNEKIDNYNTEMLNLSNLKDFYKNAYEENINQIQEIDRKISILRQEMFAKNRELRREIAKENLKKLKIRSELNGK